MGETAMSLLAIVIALFTGSPVLAEQVLYCAETDSTGFKWDDSGNASAGKFVLNLFIA
jgi:hypothetical protein